MLDPKTHSDEANLPQQISRRPAKSKIGSILRHKMLSGIPCGNERRAAGLIAMMEKIPAIISHKDASHYENPCHNHGHDFNRHR